MKRWVALGLVLLVALPATAQADTAKALADMTAKASGALAVIQYTVALETGPKMVAGQGVCILNADKLGVFLTTALDAGMKTDTLKDFVIITPGVGGKQLKAKLLGVDPWTGLGFVQATEKNDWQVVQFAQFSKLALGHEVMSIGLMMGDPARPVYIGQGFVAAKLRVPGDLAYVTGGRLTGAGSPVFNAAGQAIGIVGQQLFMGYQSPTARGLMPIQLRGQEESAFFTPVEEFVHALASLPVDGKVARLPWMGINKFEVLSEKVAETLKLEAPAVRVDEVIPAQPGAKAGLTNGDVIIEVGGKPLEELATPQLSVQNFVRNVMRMHPGQQIKLKVISGRNTKDVTVILGEMPTRPNEAPRYFNKALGLLVREKVMLDEYLDKSESAMVPGLIVLGLLKGSPAAAADLKGGDVITNVNNQTVKTIATFKDIVEKSLTASQTAPINFLVRRGPQAQVVTVKPTGN